ncbi:hypothetical protein [Streptomyces sp. NBC_01465]|uniref:hypothetical protein n=1 Tax=Streptomyces sp. NBC_01465 TaxID=2903878 RepID=UPI002E36FCDD|nr:hypothetical protein [Streptomyces sp. NBC_01465]
MRILPADDQLGGMRALLESGDALTGYEPQDFPDHCWILHAGYESGKRVRWSELLSRTGQRLEDWGHNLSYRVFDDADWSGEDSPFWNGHEGEPDRESLAHLLDVLAHHSTQGPDTPCYWAQTWFENFAHPVPARHGRLDEGLALYDDAQDPDPNHGPRMFPSQWWPEDRSWYAVTDYDLWATEVLGPPELIADLLSHDWLEAVRHPQISAIGDATKPHWRTTP